MGALFHQDLAAAQGKRLHESSQNIPVRQAELATQGVAGLALGNGLGQALNIKADGCGEWCVHNENEDTFTPQAEQVSSTVSYM